MICYIFKIWSNDELPFIYLTNASENSFHFSVFLDLNSHSIKEQNIH